MSEYNRKTINMYNSGGAYEYIENSKVDPETEKWERLFNYVQEQLLYDKKRKIIEFGSGCGELALKLQDSDYDVIATDIVGIFLNEEKARGIKNIKRFGIMHETIKIYFFIG